MQSRDYIFWEVDVQADFMLPGGKLYVPGAEKLLPNLSRLTEAARKNRVFLVSDACVHGPDDEEFQRFPPHCVRGMVAHDADVGAGARITTVVGHFIRMP